MLTEEDVKKKDILFLHTTSCDVCRVLLSRIMKCVIEFAPVMVLLDNVPEENFDFDLLDVDDIKDDFFTPLPLLSVLFTGRLREMVP